MILDCDVHSPVTTGQYNMCKPEMRIISLADGASPVSFRNNAWNRRTLVATSYCLCILESARWRKHVHLTCWQASTYFIWFSTEVRPTWNSAVTTDRCRYIKPTTNLTCINSMSRLCLTKQKVRFVLRAVDCVRLRRINEGIFVHYVFVIFYMRVVYCIESKILRNVTGTPGTNGGRFIRSSLFISQVSDFTGGVRCRPRYFQHRGW